MRRFGFRVGTEATVTVEAAQASDARDALAVLLDGATARVTAGTGVGLELADLKMSGDVVLLLIDGVDPIEPLRSALSDWKAREGGDG